jgi:phosphatidylglycerophosphate synthase
MNSHRADRVADWNKVEPSKRNVLQKVAAATRGVVTLGNVATVTGGAFVAAGLIDVHNGRTKKGVRKIAVGRLFDIGDGILADWSKTKSPLGEALDASVDKAAMLGIVLVFCKKDIISKQTAAHVLAQNFTNVCITAVAQQSDVELHPSVFGKRTMALQGALLGFSGLAQAAFDEGNEERSWQLNTCANICELGAAVTGIATSAGYAHEVYDQVAA